MAGASVAAGIGDSVAAGLPPQAEINMPINKIMKKDFRDIKAPRKKNGL